MRISRVLVTFAAGFLAGVEAGSVFGFSWWLAAILILAGVSGGLFELSGGSGRGFVVFVFAVGLFLGFFRVGTEHGAIGEAEKTFDSFLSGDNPTQIPGLVYSKNGEIVSTGEAKKFTQLDEIPFPAYGEMGLENYFKANQDGAVIRGKMTDKTVSIITSRGCPHFCNFCSIYQVWGRQWRFRSPKNVVDEIELLITKHGVQHILFEDDNMTINMTRFEHICDEIVSRGLKFTWETPNGIRGDRVTLQLAKKMKAAGCKRVRIAIENGDQHTLDKIIRKDLDLKKALQGIQACLDAELLVDCFFIFGSPV